MRRQEHEEGLPVFHALQESGLQLESTFKLVLILLAECKTQLMPHPLSIAVQQL